MGRVLRRMPRLPQWRNSTPLNLLSASVQYTPQKKPLGQNLMGRDYGMSEVLEASSQIVYTAMLGKVIPTRKLQSQLSSPAMDMAGGRGPCLNNSPPMNCGIEPTVNAKTQNESLVILSKLFHIGLHSQNVKSQKSKVINLCLGTSECAIAQKSGVGNYTQNLPGPNDIGWRTRGGHPHFLTAKPHFNLENVTEPMALNWRDTWHLQFLTTKAYFDLPVRFQRT